MALFGKKAKDAPSGTVTDDSNGGGVAIAGDDASSSDLAASDLAASDLDSGSGKKSKKAKAARAPKPTKAKAAKNGVAVGLNIGNQFIKAVEVTSKGGELTVTAMGAVPTPPESYTNGNVLSVSALSNAIKDLWRTAGIKSKVAITSVAGTGALVVRVIEVPKMTDGELKDNMKVDADRYIPFPPSEVVMDFKALRDLPSDPDAPNMEVLLAAAQREIIDLHVKVVQSAKLDPRAIDVETIAATRALQLERRGGDGYIDYNEVTGVVNLGATGAEISILRGDIVVFTRVVPNGGNAITQAISEGFGIPFSDAERVKITSADALAPAGYGMAVAGDDFGFGAPGNDFDFGGDEFSGGDFNSAFDDISADPNTAASTDDPFDLDFFNQGPPKDEPGAGHAQKEGENEEAPAFSFDFGDPTPAPASKPAPAPVPKPEPPAATPSQDAAAAAPISFDFGGSFDDEFLPTMADEENPAVPAPAAGTEKRTAQLEDFSLDANDSTPLPDLENAAPAVATSPASVNEGFSALIPSAFDFDNFDLPGIQEEGLSTVSTPISSTPISSTPISSTPISSTPISSTPISSAPVVPTAPTPPIASPGSFASTPPAPSNDNPAPFGFDDDALASKQDEPAATPSSFDFSLDAPAEPAATTPPVVTPAVVPVAVVPPTVASDPFADPFALPEEKSDASPLSLNKPATAADAPSAREADSSDAGLDLDSIFGEPTPTPTTPAASSGMDVPDFGVTPGDTSSLGANSGVDLSGIEGDLGDFTAGFGGQNDDFSSFGASLDGGAATDAATLYSLIQPSLEELSNEVRRSLEFHLGRYPDSTISRLVLLGGGAKLRNIDVFFTQSLGVPTVVANPFAHLTVRTPKLPPDYATENGPICTVALGLALRDFVD
jgi:type IV pilus assembly protein PilM